LDRAAYVAVPDAAGPALDRGLTFLEAWMPPRVRVPGSVLVAYAARRERQRLAEDARGRRVRRSNGQAVRHRRERILRAFERSSDPMVVARELGVPVRTVQRVVYGP
jgi:hypothetical protein